MNTLLIIFIWLLGSLLSYFVVKYFMIKFKKSLSFSLRTKPLYSNSDMMFNIFLSILGSWFTMIMVSLIHINLISKNYDKWLKQKSKY